MHGSTKPLYAPLSHDERIKRFRAEGPEGYTVILKDGTQAECKSTYQSPNGTRMRLRGVRRHPLVSEIVTFVVFSAEVNSDWLAQS